MFPKCGFGGDFVRDRLGEVTAWLRVGLDAWCTTFGGDAGFDAVILLETGRIVCS